MQFLFTDSQARYDACEELPKNPLFRHSLHFLPGPKHVLGPHCVGMRPTGCAEGHWDTPPQASCRIWGCGVRGEACHPSACALWRSAAERFSLDEVEDSDSDEHHQSYRTMLFPLSSAYSVLPSSQAPFRACNVNPMCWPSSGLITFSVLPLFFHLKYNNNKWHQQINLSVYHFKSFFLGVRKILSNTYYFWKIDDCNTIWSLHSGWKNKVTSHFCVALYLILGWPITSSENISHKNNLKNYADNSANSMAPCCFTYKNCSYFFLLYLVC